MRLNFRVLAVAACVAVVPASTAKAQDAIEALEQQSLLMYKKYMTNLATLIESAGTIDEARGIKGDVEARKKLLEDIKAGANKVDPKLLESSQKMASEDSKKWEAAQSDSVVKLTTEQKTMLVTGLKQYVDGMKETLGLAGEAPNLAGAVTSALTANPLKLRKIKDAMSAAKEMTTGIPALAKAHGGTIVAMKNYVTKNKLPIDASAFSFGK